MKPVALVLCVFIFGIILSTSKAQNPGKAAGRNPPPANVPRPAPDFAWSSVTGKVRRLRDLRGQPVVLIFATRPDQKEFVHQVKEITRRYRQLSVQNALFFVAFTRESGLVTRSNVPFVVLPDPISAADEYRVGDFGIAVIGPDGNLDYATDRVITGQRILDIVVNSYQRQVQTRRS
jgi:hypothetical protein